MTLKGVALHQNRKYREACANVLNEEWTRSATARLHMLDKSCDGLPYNIAFLEFDASQKQWHVIGHSRLCKVHGQENSCFVESVVVSKSKRGKGYGRKLMEETENHAAELGFSVIYLTTHDKQDFYHHVGYDYCEPIVSLGSASSLISGAIANRLLGNSQTDSSPLTNQVMMPTSSSARPPARVVPPTAPSAPPLAPSAPPPAPLALSPAPLAPPPAPVAPPLSAPRDSRSKSTDKSKPVRMSPADVFWMKKVLTPSPTQ